MKRPTLDDVAAQAGVSKTTVSRVLNGIEGAASATTSARIRFVVDELGYVPNRVAASLRRQRTSTVALVVADIANPFFGRLAVGAEAALRKDGYSLFVANTKNDPEEELRYVDLALRNQVDGLIVAPSSAEKRHIVSARSRGAEVVLVDSSLDGVDVDSVVVDNEDAARQATEHLLDLGHSRIAFISGPGLAASDLERHAGYQGALDAHGVSPDNRLVVRGDFTVDGGVDAARRVLGHSPRPTALVVANNLMTVGALHVAKSEALAIPSDLSIIGFDDMDWYDLSTPSTTAVKQPDYEMGFVAASRLLKRLRLKRKPRPERIVLDTELVLRESTGAPPL